MLSRKEFLQAQIKTHLAEITNLKEQLYQEAVKPREPKEGTVIHCTKYYGRQKPYEFIAIRRQNVTNPIGYRWYISGRSGNIPMSWDELVDFMREKENLPPKIWYAEVWTDDPEGFIE